MKRPDQGAPGDHRRSRTTSAGGEPGEDSAQLLAASEHELDVLERELGELRMLVKQSSGELEKLNQRKVLTAAAIREMEERMEHFSRQEIRAAYLNAAEAEMRAFMIAEQREQLEAKISAFERYSQFLRRTKHLLARLPVTGPVATPQAGGPVQVQVSPTFTWQYDRSEDAHSTLSGLPALPSAAGELPISMRVTHAIPPRGAPTETGYATPSAAPLARLIQTQEEVRQRIAQRLHDGPAQSLANVVLTAEICAKIVQADSRRALNELENLKVLVNNALRETRKFIFELRPMTLDDLGLVATLRQYASDLAAKHQIAVVVAAQQGDVRLPSTMEVALFRVAQEALLNAVLHARPTQVRVVLAVRPTDVSLVIEDNGAGFIVGDVLASTVYRRTTGIASMQERADMLGGGLRFESAPGSGTRIELIAPR